MSNEIATLLRAVAESGKVPTSGEIRALLRRGTRNERDEFEGAVRRAAQNVANTAEDDDVSAGDIDDVIADVVDVYGRLVVERDADAATMQEGRRLAEGIVANREKANLEQKRAAARDVIALRAPLVEVLRHAGVSGAVDPKVLDDFRLREGLSDEQRAEWRRRASAAGEKVARMRRAGLVGQADDLSIELATKLAGDLASVAAPADPLAHASGREMAEAISARANGRYT